MSRPWRRRLSIGLVLTLAAAWLGWYRWLPEYRPSLRAGERYGIDVAHHQGTIDWQRVARDGIAVAYIKATEGGDLIDPSFIANWRGADDAGIVRGAYHFFTLCRTGVDQARFFVDTVNGAGADPSAMAPAVDLELAGNCGKRPTGAALRAELTAYLKLVEAAAGKSAVLYIGRDFEARYHVRRWLARYQWRPRFLRRPDVDGWYVWQVDGLAHVKGIKGPVDLDVFR